MVLNETMNFNTHFLHTLTRTKKTIILVAISSLIIIGLLTAYNIYRNSYFAVYFPIFKTPTAINQITSENKTKSPALFYGVNVEMSQLLPSSKKYVVNSGGEDLIDIAHKLGINMFRITNATSPDNSNPNAIYTKKQWDLVLDKMQKRGIKALILIENPKVYSKNISSDYITLVQKYIIDSGVLSRPDIYGVDLKNEPAINDHNVTMMRLASKMIKNKYPAIPLTVGWWAVDTLKKDENNREIYKWDAYEAGKKLDDFIDFYSIHMYDLDKPKLFGIYPDPYLFTSNFISRVKSGLDTKKPILIEEFGAANGESISDQGTIGSLEFQAKVYEGIYQSLNDRKDNQVIGSVAYQFISRTSDPDAWAIVKDNGNYLFPASYILQKYATGKSDVPLDFLNSKNPQSYILSISDSGKTIVLNKDDIVGLSLVLNNKNDNYTFLNNKTVLYASEDLKYNSVNEKFNAVFHTTKSGTGTIRVIEKNKQGKKTEKFKVTVVVK